jgi:hypothetical protein
MHPVLTFVLGAAGALAPEIIRLYSLKTKPDEFQWSAFYVFISIAFAGLGGLVALTLPAVNWRSAFYAGISTPTVITAALKRTPVSRNPRKQKLKGEIEYEGPRSASFGTFLDAL